jgi:hypothetical protein
MAFSKIAGFEVTPLTPSSSISFFNFPDEMISRSIKSSQMLCPKSMYLFYIISCHELLGCFKFLLFITGRFFVAQMAV